MERARQRESKIERETAEETERQRETERKRRSVEDGESEHERVIQGG